MTFRPLADRTRARLFACAAALCAVPAILAPIAALPSLDPGAPLPRRDVPASAPRPFPATPAPVHIARDPFAGEPGNDPQPNRGAAAETGPARVDAIVTGNAPRALVEEAGRVRIVRPGEDFGGVPVTAIDERGIHLKNGAVVPLASGEQL